ncbi:MAG: hypothetical protein ACREF4_08905 [Gammaproteobacteria bacterium]
MPRVEGQRHGARVDSTLQAGNRIGGHARRVRDGVVLRAARQLRPRGARHDCESCDGDCRSNQ